MLLFSSCFWQHVSTLNILHAPLPAVDPQVAIYSPADRLFPHRYNADESYCVGTTDMQPVSCYLDIESIIKVAKEAEVDAIHPGYGFLSENTTFARRCAEEGIIFIGPKAETIEVCHQQVVRWGRLNACCTADCAADCTANYTADRTVLHSRHKQQRHQPYLLIPNCVGGHCVVCVQAMGDKTAARRAAIACDVPIVPGTNQALQNVEEAKEFADKVMTHTGSNSANSSSASINSSTSSGSDIISKSSSNSNSRRRGQGTTVWQAGHRYIACLGVASAGCLDTSR